MSEIMIVNTLIVNMSSKNDWLDTRGVTCVDLELLLDLQNYNEINK